MAVNGCFDFIVQKSASINHKKCSTRLRGLLKAFWSEAMYLCIWWENRGEYASLTRSKFSLKQRKTSWLVSKSSNIFLYKSFSTCNSFFSLLCASAFITIFFLHKYIGSLQKAVINPLDLNGADFMMDGCTLLGSKHPFIAIILN